MWVSLASNITVTWLVANTLVSLSLQPPCSLPLQPPCSLPLQPSCSLSLQPPCSLSSTIFPLFISLFYHKLVHGYLPRYGPVYGRNVHGSLLVPPESEALLHEAMTSQFLCLAISSDLNKLVVGTVLGHLVLINLTEYFAEFPAHYSPHFLKSHLDRQAASSRGKARLVRPAAIIMEEVEDRVRYTGLTQPEGSCPCICIPCHPVYSGYRSWTQRLATLGRNVNSFQPFSGGYLNLSRDFELKVGGGRIGGGGVTHSHCWYKEPIVSHVYYPGFKKPSVVIGEATQVVGGGGPPLERVLTDRYVNRCILPSATPTMGVVCRVSYIEVMSLMVVAYYVAVDGSHAGEGNPLVGLAEYKIDQQTYSATR